MNVTNALLDRVKDANGLTSDYQLAKFMEWTPQRVSTYRRRGSGLDTTAALQIAQALQADPLQIMARLEIERAPNERVKTLWEKYAGRLLLAVVTTSAIATGSTLQNIDYTHVTAALDSRNIHYTQLLAGLVLAMLISWKIKERGHLAPFVLPCSRC